MSVPRRSSRGRCGWQTRRRRGSRDVGSRSTEVRHPCSLANRMWVLRPAGWRVLPILLPAVRVRSRMLWLNRIRSTPRAVVEYVR
jgi:hypothetical protein